jgi:hypothetical protein
MPKTTGRREVHTLQRHWTNIDLDSRRLACLSECFFFYITSRKVFEFKHVGLWPVFDRNSTTNKFSCPLQCCYAFRLLQVATIRECMSLYQSLVMAALLTLCSLHNNISAAITKGWYNNILDSYVLVNATRNPWWLLPVGAETPRSSVKDKCRNTIYYRHDGRYRKYYTRQAMYV